MRSTARTRIAWAVIAAVITVPIVAAALSPLLQWRDPIYIAAGFAGIFALGLLFVQPILAKGILAGFTGSKGRRAHHWIGTLIGLSVLGHVGGLWLTSPPDVVDVLLFRSPTPFAVWGAAAMWAVFATALVAALRRRLRISPRRWRQGHGLLAAIIVIGSVIHAMLIEGTMEVMSKSALCALVVIAAAWGFGSQRPRRSSGSA